MNALRPVTRLPAAFIRAGVRGFTKGFDALVGPVGRLNDRMEAHLLERTPLLRRHYADIANRQAAPLPILDAPIDLALRDGIGETGPHRPT